MVEPIAILQWAGVLETLRLDFVWKLLLGAVLGGLIGLDREASGKPAGLRTNMLICIGSTLLADLSIRFVEFEAVRAELMDRPEVRSLQVERTGD